MLREEKVGIGREKEERSYSVKNGCPTSSCHVIHLCLSFAININEVY